MKYLSYRSGIIVDISQKNDDKTRFITIAKDVNDIYTYTRLVYSKETIILDCDYNEIKLSDLSVGNSVFVYHSNAMTMSIPPQTVVHIIEVK